MELPKNSHHSDLFKRYHKNPFLAPSDWPYKCNSIFNAAATIYNNKVLILCRVEDMKGASHLCKAVSDDGFTNWQIDKEPTMIAEPDKYPEEAYGIEDPRIVLLDDPDEPDGTFAVTYTSFSTNGPLVSLATTKDFVSFKRYGVVMPPDDKDASLFPRRFNGKWMLIHRPTPTSWSLGAHIWVSMSPDLKHWGDSQVLIPARKGSWWDAYKVGLGPQPVLTKDGWLIIYHGVRTTAAGSIYRLGLAMLDLDDPTKIIKRCDEWVFGPQEIYERIGDVPDVTFPCGVVVKDDQLIMYYGAADTSMAIATASMSDVLEYIKNA